MTTILYMRTGHAYRVSDSLTLQGVNDALDTNPDRFIEVPGPVTAVAAGTPGQGETIAHLLITPSSVSHFVVV